MLFLYFILFLTKVRAQRIVLVRIDSIIQRKKISKFLIEYSNRNAMILFICVNLLQSNHTSKHLGTATPSKSQYVAWCASTRSIRFTSSSTTWTPLDVIWQWSTDGEHTSYVFVSKQSNFIHNIYNTQAHTTQIETMKSKQLLYCLSYRILKHHQKNLINSNQIDLIIKMNVLKLRSILVWRKNHFNDFILFEFDLYTLKQTNKQWKPFLKRLNRKMYSFN